MSVVPKIARNREKPRAPARAVRVEPLHRRLGIPRRDIKTAIKLVVAGAATAILISAFESYTWGG